MCIFKITPLIMTKKLLLSLAVLLSALITTAQVSENFTDGNFTASPIWTGNTTDWIINAAAQLQSNNTVANSTFYLSTANTLATSAEWSFYVNLKFATSGTNYADIYLTSSASNITGITSTGYFVRIGNTADEISLYRKDAGIAAGVKIIDGVDAAVNSSTNNQIKIKVIRNAANQWKLLRELSGTGAAYFNEGTVIDATYTSSAFFGFIVKQSTVASFAQKHFFDDIEIKPFVEDLTAPVLETITITTAKTLDVLFNEGLDKNSSEQLLNYVADNLVGSPVAATLDGVNPALIHLSFANNFPDGVNCLLTINGVKDIAGNAVSNASGEFIYHAPYIANQYDVVIDEMMTDPTPANMLPNNEWIELRNTTSKSINLSGFKLGSATNISGAMQDFILKPDSFVIIGAAANVAAMAPFGTILSVSNFPSLDNEAGQLSLISLQGKTIHSVSYSSAWYQNELKKDGGWSLEMTDTKNPCSGISNWKASTNLKGGSPGIKNSNDGINADKIAPKILRAYAIDNTTINLLFNEPLDSTKAATISNYSISDGVGNPVNAVAQVAVFDRVILKLNTDLLADKVYEVTVTNITDCMGNTIATNNKVKVALSSVAESKDIIVNEILFNPPSAGSDYVEIYNRSNKTIDLKQTYIANRNSTGNLSDITPLSTDNHLLFPKEFMVLTNDVEWVKAAYIYENPLSFLKVNLPVFNDDKSNVILLNAQGTISDEVPYSDKWHFKLLDNKEGVALERIDYNGLSNVADNWHSAATSVGYGTPSYKNSQYRITDAVQGTIRSSPDIISPDNDGQDDFATIDYDFPQPGYVANITIFDASGRAVRYLQKNALCGTKGNFRWDGLGEKNQSLATGIYIVFTEVFNLQGNTKQFKTAIVLARRT